MSGTTLGARLRALRDGRGWTQAEIARRLDLKRATIAQWEGDRHLPSAENVQRLDDLLQARGTLVAHAENARSGVGGDDEPVLPHRSLAEVFSSVADAVVGAVRTEGEVIGWSHNLLAGPPTPLSSAYAIRTLQLLDDARVDLHAVGRSIRERRNEDGTWSPRPRLKRWPAATAQVQTTLARMGLLADVDAELEVLRADLTPHTRARPYLLTVLLESILSIRPEHPLVDMFVEALLAARVRRDGVDLWAPNVGERRDLAEPSLAHTARAVSALRDVPDADGAVEDAIGAAIAWMVARSESDDGFGEKFDPAPDVAGTKITVNHFSAAWCIRAMVGRDDVPAHRLARSVAEVWNNFDGARENLWCWRSDLTFPSWMTLDAVAALRAAALTAHPTPLPLVSENP